MKQLLSVILFVLAAHQPVRALINPTCTPADLVKTVTVVAEMQLGADGQVRDLKALKGDAPKELRITIDEAVTEMFAGTDQQPALLFIGDLTVAGETTEATPAVGAIHTRNGWLGLYAGADGKHTLATDQRGLKTVWAGSTAMLGRALRYVLNDPNRAAFPVVVGVAWRSETNIVNLAQPIAGLQAVELAAGAPPVLHVLSPAGDRLGDRVLPAKSQRACWTDLDGDGRLDLVSWDGTNVAVFAQNAAGAFAGKEGRCELPGVTSLVSLKRGMVAAGGAGKVTVLTADLKVAQTLTVTDDLGVAGPVVAGDFDGDGAIDLVQAYEQGLVAWPGASGAARVVFRGRLGKLLVAMEAGDFDSDGLPDLLLGGRQGAGEGGGANLLANTGAWTFAAAWDDGGEIHKVQTRVRNVQVCDINNDSRPDMMLTFERSGPAFFFNRGFRVFGASDELSLAGKTADDKTMVAGNAFNTGAAFGVVADFDGDGAQDGAFATATGDVWIVWRARGAACNGLLMASPGTGPVQVKITDGPTLLGVLMALPGRPAYSGFASKGGIKLEWTGSDGKPRTRTVPVIKPLTRVELTD